MSATLVRAVLLGAAGLTAGGCATHRTTTEPRWRIAYNVRVDATADDYDVFVMELDGSGQRNVTQHPAVDWAYVGHGDRLYLASDRDDEKRRYHLYEWREGQALRRVTEFRVRDSWLGTRADGALVVASSKDGTADLYLIDRDGRELGRLTDDAAYDNDPVFSPDGGRVVWRSQRSPDSPLDELWLLDLASGEMRQLTHFPADDPAHDEPGYHAGPPAWEATRDRISFCSMRGEVSAIFSIRPDGSGLERLSPQGADACWHAWSPDGRYLAYDARDTGGNYDIWVLDTASGRVTRLTDDPQHEQAPAFLAP